METKIIQPKFRASSCSALLTEPKLKSEKEAGMLGETAKSFVEEVWLKNNYGYKPLIDNKYFYKGNYCEMDSMKLVQKVLGGEFREKYKNILQAQGLKHLEDEYFTGTPDIVLRKEDFVEDTKTSWDISSFLKAELKKEYYCQGQVYMRLTGKKYYRLIYCLVPSPEETIIGEKNKLFYALHCEKEQSENEDYIEGAKQIEWNHRDMILEIPEIERVKIFEFNYDPEYMDKLISQVFKAREFYNTIKLNDHKFLKP